MTEIRKSMMSSHHVVITINKGLYAFESHYFDVIHQSVCTAPLQVEHTLNLQWSGGTAAMWYKL